MAEETKKFEDLSLDEMDSVLMQMHNSHEEGVARMAAMKSARDRKHAESMAEETLAKMGPHMAAAVVRKAQSIAAGSISPKSAVGTPGK